MSPFQTGRAIFDGSGAAKVIDFGLALGASAGDEAGFFIIQRIDRDGGIGQTQGLRKGFDDFFATPEGKMDAQEMIDRMIEIVPAAALEWSGNEDGTVWTFTLDPALMWNDGNPVTANDWVATFRYGADPAHAWDFTWYFSGVIKNWTQAVAGEELEHLLEAIGLRNAVRLDEEEARGSRERAFP